MSSISAQSLSERASSLTARNAAGARPATYVVQNPFDEVLIEEIAAMLPPPLATALRAAPSAQQAQDWLAAGALYPLVADDPFVARRFVEQIRLNPRRANEKLVEAIVRRKEPPDVDARWHHLDQAGLLLQAIAVLAVLAGRWLLFSAISALAIQPAVSGWWSWLVQAGSAARLLTGAPRDAFWCPVYLSVAALWMAFEARCAPRLFEVLRRAPAKPARLPLPVSWRIDAFHVAWYCQAAVLFALIAARTYWLSAAAIYQDRMTLLQGCAAGVTLVIVAAMLRVVLRSARDILDLGR